MSPWAFINGQWRNLAGTKVGGLTDGFGLPIDTPATGDVDVGRSTVSLALRAPAVAKELDVGRATATVTARAPAVTKTEDVGRGLVSANVAQGATSVGAVAFNADVDGLAGSDAPSSDRSFTVCGWFRWNGAPTGDNNVIFGVDEGNGYSGTSKNVEVQSTGAVRIYDNFGTQAVGLTLSGSSGWYFFALVCDATPDLTLYWRAQAETTLSSSTKTGTNTGGAFTGVAIGATPSFSTWVDGSIAMVRLFDKALSSAEALAESNAATAVLTGDLLGEYPLASAATKLTASTGTNLTAIGAGSWTDDTGPTFGSGGLGVTKTEDVGRATATVATYTPTVVTSAVDVGRATVSTTARAPAAAKALDVGRSTASTTARAPTIAKTEDVGRATATVATYLPEVRPIQVPVGRATVSTAATAPTVAKAEDVGRATASLAARAPVPAKALDAGRATSSTLARAPAPAKALSVGRAAASVAAYAPSLSRSVSVGRATSSVTARAPSWAKGLEVGRVTATVAAYVPTVGYSTITVDVDGRATAGTSASSPTWSKALDAGRATASTAARAPSPVSWLAPRMRPGQSWAGVATGGATASATGTSSSAQAETTGSTASAAGGGATAER